MGPKTSQGSVFVSLPIRQIKGTVPNGELSLGKKQNNIFFFKICMEIGKIIPVNPQKYVILCVKKKYQTFLLLTTCCGVA